MVYNRWLYDIPSTSFKKRYLESSGPDLQRLPQSGEKTPRRRLGDSALGIRVSFVDEFNAKVMQGGPPTSYNWVYDSYN